MISNRFRPATLALITDTVDVISRERFRLKTPLLAARSSTANGTTWPLTGPAEPFTMEVVQMRPSPTDLFDLAYDAILNREPQPA
jgi:hypothetical protein